MRVPSRKTTAFRQCAVNGRNPPGGEADHWEFALDCGRDAANIRAHRDPCGLFRVRSHQSAGLGTPRGECRKGAAGHSARVMAVMAHLMATHPGITDRSGTGRQVPSMSDAWRPQSAGPNVAASAAVTFAVALSTREGSAHSSNHEFRTQVGATGSVSRPRSVAGGVS